MCVIPKKLCQNPLCTNQPYVVEPEINTYLDLFVYFRLTCFIIIVEKLVFSANIKKNVVLCVRSHVEKPVKQLVTCLTCQIPATGCLGWLAFSFGNVRCHLL